VSECPEFHRGCCKNGYCMAPGYQVKVKDWEETCVKPGDWGECTIYLGSSSSKP